METRRLWPHPPTELANRYVEAMGGLDQVVESPGRPSSGRLPLGGDPAGPCGLRRPGPRCRRPLYADTLEQLGYGSENGTWRNFFLSGATELRGSTSGPRLRRRHRRSSPSSPRTSSSVPLRSRSTDPKSWDLDLSLNMTLADLDMDFRVTLRNGVLVSTPRPADATAALTLPLTKSRMLALLGGDMDSAGIDLAGDATVLQALLGVLEKGDPSFNIVTP